VGNASKSVVLLASSSNPHLPFATAFFVTGPSKATFLVTAGHALSRLTCQYHLERARSPLVAICNPPQGPSHSMLLPRNWFGHQDTDVAVLPCPLWPHLDISPLPFSSLPGCPSPNFPSSARLIGPSLTSSLLHLGYAKRRFNPTSRQGALLKLEHNLLNSTPTPIPEAYLATFASAPGHSGSPVLADLEDDLLLLGILIGSLNVIDHAPAVVIPAHRVREIILEATADLAFPSVLPSASMSCIPASLRGRP
jgi:hypothetical protein